MFVEPSVKEVLLEAAELVGFGWQRFLWSVTSSGWEVDEPNEEQQTHIGG